MSRVLSLFSHTFLTHTVPFVLCFLFASLRCSYIDVYFCNESMYVSMLFVFLFFFFLLLVQQTHTSVWLILSLFYLTIVFLSTVLQSNAPVTSIEFNRFTRTTTTHSTNKSG